MFKQKEVKRNTGIKFGHQRRSKERKKQETKGKKKQKGNLRIV